MKDTMVKILGRSAYALSELAKEHYNRQMRSRAHVDPSVILVGKVYLDENVYIGKGTAIASGQIFAGENSKVQIGKYCAIGERVSIKARTHDPMKGTTASEKRKTNLRIELDIIIGDYCWIGDNVFIDAGVTIGNQVIIGANAVVVKDVPSYSCAGGVPARVLYDRRERGFDENA